MTTGGAAPIIGPISRVDRVAGRALREGERRERKNGRRRASAVQAEAHKARMAALTEAHKTDFKRISIGPTSSSRVPSRPPSRATPSARWPVAGWPPTNPRSWTPCWAVSARCAAS
jgi:hypothetical protein